ncbi:unnamed protein product [Allacma fusca]|uniref:Uncharacterized protein n=1 Tax=Allacma fusca TaxID=39272 RepID=A0A8J2PRA7_9HEXA|nr:unnamed protein product [Allacma fusca]
MDKSTNRVKNTKESLPRNINSRKQSIRTSSTGGNLVNARKSENWSRNSVLNNQNPRTSVSGGTRNSVASIRSFRGQPGKATFNNKPNRNVKSPEVSSNSYKSPSWDSRDSEGLLGLPRKVRLLIWNRLRLMDQLKLRLICSIVKKDIDGFIGVKVELDDVDESFPHLIKLGIKSAIILDIPSINGKFLQYPELLKELTILGGIKSNCFASILKECQNITHLIIQFSKDLFTLKPRLFPVMINEKVSGNIIPHLKYLEFQSTTKNDLELDYVKRNFFGLVNNHLLDRVHPHFLRVTIVHKFYNEIVEECSQLMSILVHNNLQVVKDLEVDIKCLGTLGLPEDVDNTNNEDEETDYMANFFDTDDCSEDRKQPGWQLFPNLKNLHFSTNPKDYQCYWKNMSQHIRFLETLYLEIHSPTSWDFYKTFIKGESIMQLRILKAPHLQHLRIGYWSSSDGSFGRLLWLLRYECITFYEYHFTPTSKPGGLSTPGNRKDPGTTPILRLCSFIGRCEVWGFRNTKKPLRRKLYYDRLDRVR